VPGVNFKVSSHGSVAGQAGAADVAHVAADLVQEVHLVDVV
jgi:hypothetical protein